MDNEEEEIQIMPRKTQVSQRAPKISKPEELESYTLVKYFSFQTSPNNLKNTRLKPRKLPVANTSKKVDRTKDSNESQLSPKRLSASSNESQLNSKRLFANESPFKEENLRTKSRALLTVNERIPKDYKNSVLRPRKLPEANTSRNISKSSVRQKRPSKIQVLMTLLEARSFMNEMIEKNTLKIRSRFRRGPGRLAKPQWSQNEYQNLIKMEAKMDAVRQNSSDVKNWKLES